MTKVTRALFLLATILALLPAAEAQSTTFTVKPGVVLWHVWTNPVNHDRIAKKYDWAALRDKVTELNPTILKKKGDEPYTHLAPGTQLKLPDDVFAQADSGLAAENAELKKQLGAANDELVSLGKKNDTLTTQLQHSAVHQESIWANALMIVSLILLIAAVIILIIMWRRRGEEIKVLRARVYTIHPEPPPAEA